MFFTQDDYKKIQQWLIKNSVKDTEFNEANIPFNGEETITIVQGNQNKKVFLKDLIAQVFNLGISDFVNITDKYDAPNISLEEAIRLIPSRARKEGQVITFLDREDHWHIYQFKGVLNQWNVLDTWEDLFNWEKLIIDSILPDEEDLTKSPADANGNSYLSLKDREYNPEDFSGLGRVILRKNIVEVEDPIYGKVKKNVLYQDMINKENTIYEIRYDFDLNGQEITIPEGCVLDFQGGSLGNGTIGGNKTTILDKNSILYNIKFNGSFVNTKAKLSWFSDVNNDSNNFKNLWNTFDHIILNRPFIIEGSFIKESKKSIIIDGCNNEFIVKFKDTDLDCKKFYIAKSENINIINAKFKCEVESLKSIEDFHTLFFITQDYSDVNNICNIDINNIEIYGFDNKHTAPASFCGIRINYPRKGSTINIENCNIHNNYVLGDGIEYTKQGANYPICIQTKPNEISGTGRIHKCRIENIFNYNPSTKSDFLYIEDCAGIYLMGDSKTTKWDFIIDNITFKDVSKRALKIQGTDCRVTNIRAELNGTTKQNAIVELQGLYNFVENIYGDFDNYVITGYSNFVANNIIVTYKGANETYDSLFKTPIGGTYNIRNVKCLNAVPALSTITVPSLEYDDKTSICFENLDVFINKRIFEKYDSTPEYINDVNIAILNSDVVCSCALTSSRNQNIKFIDSRLKFERVMSSNNPIEFERCFMTFTDAITSGALLNFYNLIINNSVINNNSNSNYLATAQNKISISNVEINSIEGYIEIPSTNNYSYFKNIKNNNKISLKCRQGSKDLILDNCSKIRAEVFTTDDNPSVNRIKVYDSDISLFNYFDISQIVDCNKVIVIPGLISNVKVLPAGLQIHSTATGLLYTSDGINWITYDGNSSVVNKIGYRDQRPASDIINHGFQYFDKSLNKPIWWNGNEWIDATKNNADFYHTEYFKNKPENSPIGFQFYCLDKTSVKGNKSIPIYHSGNNIWVDAMGRVVDDNYPISQAGDTNNRPVLNSDQINFQYFDITLNKPIWWTGSKWVDATGADV